MKRKIIITDLTRFKESNPDVCMAGIDIDNGECIRPFRYLTKQECEKYNVLPGSILSGSFTPSQRIVLPHTEDHHWSNLELEGACTSDEFYQILENSESEDISSGFGIDLDHGQKHIDINDADNVKASIITVRVDPNNLQVVKDNYGNIKVHLTDAAGARYRYLPLTDLGFYNFIKRHGANLDRALSDVSKYIGQQDEVLLRIGLSRVHQKDDRNGFWIQVNGIYTFPNFYQDIRSYK